MEERPEKPQLRTYEPPEITVVGALVDHTLAHHIGLRLDANFAAGTPLNQLTTSI